MYLGQFGRTAHKGWWYDGIEPILAPSMNSQTLLWISSIRQGDNEGALDYR